jgi:hypothetical protein
MQRSVRHDSNDGACSKARCPQHTPPAAATSSSRSRWRFGDAPQHVLGVTRSVEVSERRDAQVQKQCRERIDLLAAGRAIREV